MASANMFSVNREAARPLPLATFEGNSGRAGGPQEAAAEDLAMDDGSIDVKRAARDAVYAMDLKDINPVDPEAFRNDTWAPIFERLRAEDPVHWAVSDEEEI